MKRLAVTLAAGLLGGCALLSSPVVQECAIPVAVATYHTVAHDGQAENAWIHVAQVALRESSRANARFDSQNLRSDVYK